MPVSPRHRTTTPGRKGKQEKEENFELMPELPNLSRTRAARRILTIRCHTLHSFFATPATTVSPDGSSDREQDKRMQSPRHCYPSHSRVDSELARASPRRPQLATTTNREEVSTARINRRTMALIPGLERPATKPSAVC